jgi:N-carbamoylputrescine amidase
MKVALVTEVFIGEGAPHRLRRVVRRAGDAGAGLVVLPELALDPWFPATPDTNARDAEPPGGPRHRLLASVAREEGVGIVGGAVVVEPGTGRRFSTALVFDAAGAVAGSYRKMHLPNEDGFWEAAHYEPGEDPPSVIEAFGVPIGIQLCSDINRPEGSHVLGALGAEAILAPRGTPAATYERWKLVLRANAVTSCAYVLSTNRPGPERGVGIGGPSVAIAPDGQVLVETTDPLSFVTLDRAVVARARAEYPGYLTIRSDVYARAWRAAGRRAGG